MMQTRTSFNNYGIAQRLRPCNLHSPLSLRINAIVDDHIAVAVALVFAKLSIGVNEDRAREVFSISAPLTVDRRTVKLYFRLG
jgi:hypothetical protein